MSLNKCFLQGNLTRDPELRELDGDRVVVKFGVGVSERPYKDKAGNTQKGDPMFVDCEAWGPVARVINEHFRKGKGIIISGAQLKLDTWDDKTTGTKRSKHFLRVTDFDFPLGKGGDDNGPAAAQAAGTAKAAPKKAASKKAPPKDAPPDDGVGAPDVNGGGDQIPF